jgi:hypothetical protein
MKHTRTIALVSTAGSILFFVIVFLQHFLRPGKNMLSCFVSEYAVGDYGWLMTIGFFSLATAALLLLIGLPMNLTASKLSKITLGIFCVGSLLFSIFPTDVPVVFPPTPRGLIHGFAALIALIVLGIAMIAWGVVFKKNENWKSLAKPSLFFGVMSLILFIIFFASPVTLRGLTERILLVWDVSWLLLVSRKLYKTA